MSDRSYINEDGFVVFTSKHLRAKKSCCHSNCLHCPYGTTLKNIGVEITHNSKFDSDLVTDLRNKIFPSDEYSSSLLSEAFGKSDKFSDSDLFVLSLKGVICGLAYISNSRLAKFALKEHFQDQGITDTYLRGIIEN